MYGLSLWIVFHLLQELVELHPHGLVIRAPISRKLLHLLLVVVLVNMRHRRLVDVENGIDILTRIGLVLLTGILVEGEFSPMDFVLPPSARLRACREAWPR